MIHPNILPTYKQRQIERKAMKELLQSLEATADLMIAANLDPLEAVKMFSKALKKPRRKEVVSIAAFTPATAKLISIVAFAEMLNFHP